MKTYTIKTKKNGQQWNETGEIYAENWQEAKRKFTDNMRNFAAGYCGYMYVGKKEDLNKQGSQFAVFQGAGFYPEYDADVILDGVNVSSFYEDSTTYTINRV